MGVSWSCLGSTGTSSCAPHAPSSSRDQLPACAYSSRGWQSHRATGNAQGLLRSWPQSGFLLSSLLLLPKQVTWGQAQSHRWRTVSCLFSESHYRVGANNAICHRYHSCYPHLTDGEDEGQREKVAPQGHTALGAGIQSSACV